MSSATPPGWYPDANVSGQQRYWDGTAWTKHTAPGRTSYPQLPQGQGTQHGLTPEKKPNWLLRHKILSSVLALFVIFVLIGAASGGSGDAKKASASTATQQSTSSQPSPTKSEEPAIKSTPKPKAKPKPKPSLQDRFIGTVEVGEAAADKSDNEIQVVQARKKRAVAMCGLLPQSRAVTGWKGKVDEVSTELGGDSGVLSIVLTDEIKVSTWNNSASDYEAHTMISPSSPLYASMADLSEGDSVIFSGNFIHGNDCLEEQSLMDANGLLTPTFSFKFSSIKKS